MMTIPIIALRVVKYRQQYEQIAVYVVDLLFISKILTLPFLR